MSSPPPSTAQSAADSGFGQSQAKPPRTGLAWHLPALLLLLALALLRHEELLPGRGLILDADVLQEHQPAYSLLQGAWDEGALLPFWNRHAFSGSPYFPVIDKPLLYPPTWLMLSCFEPERAFLWSIPLHSVLAAWAMYALAWYLTRHRSVAMVAGALFSTGMLLTRIHTGLPYWGYAEAWLPLVALSALKCMKSSRPSHHAILLGLFIALQVHAGGIFVASYSAMLVAAIFLFGQTGGNPRVQRILAATGISLPVAFGLTAVRLIPMFLWIDLTTRGESLGLRESLGEVFKPLEQFGGRQHALSFGLWTLCGVLCLWRTWRRGLSFFAAALLALILAGGYFHETLYEWIPGYDRTRHVARALVLYVPSAIALGAIGAGALLDCILAGRTPAKWLRHLALPLIALCVAFEQDLFRDNAQGTRLIEAPRNEWAAAAQSGPEAAGFRYYTTARWDLARTYANGGEATNGRLGGLRYKDYDAAMDSLAGEKLVAALRILGCRLALLRNARELPGLVPMGPIQVDAIEAELGAGTRVLHRVERPLGRAQPIANAIAISPASHPELERRLRSRPNFDPLHTALIRLDSGAALDLSKFDSLICDSALQSAPQVRSFEGPVVLDQAPLEEFDQLFGAPPKSSATPLAHRAAGNRLDIELNGTSGWVKLSETMVRYPGWVATADGKAVDLHLADGLVSAAFIPTASEQLRLHYTPPGLFIGATITMASSLLISLLWLLLRRRMSAGITH